MVRTGTQGSKLSGRTRHGRQLSYETTRSLLDLLTLSQEQSPTEAKPILELDLDDEEDMARSNRNHAAASNQLVISSASTRSLLPLFAPGSSAEAARFTFVEALILSLCQHHEQEPAKQREMYLKLCEMFNRVNLIGASYSLLDLDLIRQNMALCLNKMARDISRSDRCLPPTKSFLITESKLLSSQLDSVCLDANRYAETFRDEVLIAKGGFGSVYRSKHILDQGDYAIKKIRITVKSLECYTKLFREVQLYAKLPPHPNVVNYKTTWLGELKFSIPKSKPCVNEISDDSSNAETTSTRDSEPIQSNFRMPKDYHEDLPDEDSFDIGFEPNAADFIATVRKPTIVEVTETGVVSRRENRSNHTSRTSAGFTLESEECSELPVSAMEGGDDLRQACAKAVPFLISRRRTNTEKSEAAQSLSDSEFDYGRLSRKTVAGGKETNNLALQRLPRETPCVPCTLEHSATLFIQMELCDKNLQTWIKERNEDVLKRAAGDEDGQALDFIDSSEALEIFRQIVKGVEFLHSHNLIHRDLKPPNILFSMGGGNNKVKIGDFGLATLHSEDVINFEAASQRDVSSSPLPSSSTDGHTGGVGTTVYAAPEQRDSNSYDVKADIYSLGIILFEMFCPNYTSMERHSLIRQLKNKTLPSELVKKWPDVAKAILELTSFQASERPSAAAILKSSLFPTKNQRISGLREDNRKLLEDNRKLREDAFLLKEEISLLKRLVSAAEQKEATPQQKSRSCEVVKS